VIQKYYIMGFMEKSIIDRLVEDKRQAIKDAKKNLQKPQYQEALKRLRLKNEARRTDTAGV
jgi:hypothetical protein